LDPTLSTLPTVTGQNGVTVSLSNVYRRILPVDLNVDGRDDIVYRSEIAYGGYQCLGWVVRWNLGAGPNGATFSAPAMLPGSEQSDPNCYGDNTKFAYPGDLLFADYNLDDFPDFFNAVGIGGVKAPSWPGVPGPDWTSMTRYDYYEASCPVPGGLLSCHGWAGSQSFDDPTKVTATSPWLSVGDITGEGIPELIRPQAFAGTGLYWRTSSSEWGIVPAMTGSLKGYQVMDIDGDGTPEVIRDTGGHQSVVSSPTMNVTTNSIPPIHSTTPNPQYVHWFLDLNGDGLMDIAEVEATNPTSIITRMNTGKDFAPPVGTVLPLGSRIGQSWRDSHENGVRIVDFDLDGRQDLLLLDSGPEPGVASTRSTARVLKSDGLGGFVSQFSPTFPIGEFSDGAQAGKQVTNPVTPASHGYRTSVTLDLNGDGLTDVMQIEDGRPTMYVRQGKRPDMVTRIAEGHGRQIDIEYGPASDPEVHTRDLATCHGADPQRRLACLIKDRWLPKAITVSGWSLPGESVSETTRYKYTGGLFDRLGRGFLGFMRRDVFASTSKHTTIKYAASTLLNLNGNNYPPHTYPLALTPSEITVDVDTPHGPNTHQREVQTFTYFTTPTSWAPTTIRNTSRYMVLLQGITKKKYDCVGDGAGGCSGPLRVLSWQDDTYQYHPEYNYNEMGKPTIHSTFFRDENGIPLRTDMEVTTYAPFDSANWLMQTTEIQLKSWSFTVAPTDDVTRTFKFTPDLEPSPNTALLTGDAASVEIEPWVGSPERRLLTFGRDTRGRLTNLEDKEVATGVRRWTSSLYEDADGVYESTTFNSLGHRTRTWRHPGFGFVVEVDDPNNVASVKTYDTFGRLLDETAVSGASTSYAYADTADPILAGGTDMTILPEGRATRAIQVHTSSFGKETARTTPIDSGRTTTTRSRFDAFGRLVQKNVSGGPAGGESIFNTYIYQYDDLDRLLSECHLATDGLNHCKTNQYDGLSVAQSDESGRTITNISDPLGRPSIQRAAGMADATFTYGSFGLLRSQKLADGSGQTDFTYDVLGRRTSITRTDTGTRRTKYNAFNEVVETWKQKPDGTEVEKLTYGYDPLGRVVSVTGSGINRTLYYDRTHTGGVAQNAIGKLVDLFDDGSHVHVEYDEKGLVSSKSWMISMFAPLAHYGTMSFLYDSQGRLERQTFPKNVYGNYTALSLVHRYDPYTGGEASIADAENPSVPLWQVTERNDLGQITNEALNSHSGVSMSRTSNYYFATGQLSTSSLTGSEGQVAQLFYTYQPDALPNTVGMAGVGGSWTSQFDYDNLGRLTTWIPGQCCGGINVTLSYAYDSDGNLIGRSWGSPGGGENVSYGKGPGFEGGISRTVSTSGSGIQPWTDIYVFDRWGRMLGGPSVSLVYNANDEVVGAVGQSGQYEVNYHDGLGERIATQYGDGSYLVKLMGDEYEFRYDGTMFTTEERVRFRADGKVVGDVVRTSSTSKTTTFYLTDAMGSVLAEASTTGTVTARAKRDPYGNRLDSPDWPMLPREPGGADPDGSSRFGYAGHEREANWGLIDMKARFYNPRLGRFITPDSVIGNAADRRAYNAFAYAWNNPVAMVDPHGHDPDGVLRHTYVPGETRSPHRDGTDGVSGHDPQQPQHQPSAPAVVNAPVSAGTPMSVVTGSSVAGPTNGAQGTSGFDPTGPDDSPTEAQVIAALDLMIYAASLAFPPLAPLGIAWGGFKTGYYIGKEQYNDAAWAAAGVVGSVATQGQPVQGLIMKETNIIMKEASGDHTIDPDTYQNQEDGQAAGEAAAQAARTAGPGAKSGAEGASGTDRGAGGGGSQPSSSSQGGGSGGGGPTGSEGTTGHGCGPCTGMR
jgi:RHS repeat-associated protein